MTPKRGPYKVGLRKRSEILDAALQEFARAGFEAASLRSIAKLCDITHAGLLHHFGSKRELLLEVLAVQEDRDRALTARHVGPADLDALLATLTAVSDRHLANPSWARLWITLKLSAGDDAEHVAHNYIARRTSAWIAELESLLLAAQKRNLVRNDLDCRAAATGLLALQEGLHLLAISDATADVRRPLEWTVEQMRA